MNPDVEVDEERGNDADAAGTSPFLPVLRQRMERTLIGDATEPKKVGLGDYLKLATLLEIARAASGEDLKEVVVRWEDPSDGENEDAD